MKKGDIVFVKEYYKVLSISTKKGVVLEDIDGDVLITSLDRVFEDKEQDQLSAIVVCEDWIHDLRVKNNDDNYCPICGEQLQNKKP